MWRRTQEARGVLNFAVFHHKNLNLYTLQQSFPPSPQGSSGPDHHVRGGSPGGGCCAPPGTGASTAGHTLRFGSRHVTKDLTTACPSLCDRIGVRSVARSARRAQVRLQPRRHHRPVWPGPATCPRRRRRRRAELRRGVRRAGKGRAPRGNRRDVHRRGQCR